MHTLSQLLSGELAGVTKLKIAEGLTTFPPEILDLADTLEILDLSGNQLKALPADFARLQKLKVAFFSDNDFTQFPAVLAQCPELTMIGFKANKIALIPEEALSPHLRWLILTNNALTRLPAAIGRCHRLQKCMLAGNRLTQLPPEMAHCHNLELLRISANQLTELPGWLLSLPRLSWLAYAGNPCSLPPPAPENLPYIAWEDLQLSEVLGEGASGVISKATWQRTGADTQPVAVKVFKGEVTSDGLPGDEMAASLAAGAHPNLVPVLGRIQNHPNQKQGLVLNLIPPVYRNLGLPPTFASCTRDHYPVGTTFTLAEILAIAGGIASATAHLHARGILHGDLYAHNILVDDAAHALFGDFGAATLYRGAGPELAARLERLEVRAFGCLLEDLLNHLAPADTGKTESVAALHNLKKACLAEEIRHRPDFRNIWMEVEMAGSLV